HPVYTKEAISAMGGTKYASTLVSMVTGVVGKWSYYVIAIAAFATMFGTSITLIDGYCRSVERTISLLKKEGNKKTTMDTKQYLVWVSVLMIGSLLLIFFFVQNLGQIVNLATILSFIIAPFAAILNYKIVMSKEISTEFRPPMWLRILAIAGIVFLTVFTVLYLFK
ncbi:MAG: hypothetical protein AB8B61_01135, partial [Cyclobacteriaceae bacterium]